MKARKIGHRDSVGGTKTYALTLADGRPRCQGTASDNSTFLTHFFQCSRAGKVERGDYWYCGTHDPQAKESKRDAEREAAKLGDAMQSARAEVRRAEDEILQACRTLDQRFALEFRIRKLLAADRKYEEAKAAADANGKVSKYYYGR